MISAIRRHASFANVVSLMALFVALGGTAVAVKVKLKPGQVKTKNIKAKAVTEPKLADGAVSEPKIMNGAVSEPKIKDGAVTIGKVGASTHLLCRAGTTYTRGGCLENAPRAADTWANAIAACAAAGASVATPEELMAFLARGGVISNANSAEWTENSHSNTDAVQFSSAGVPEDNGKGNAREYRCSFSPTG